MLLNNTKSVTVQSWTFILAAMFALIVVHGLGRFAFTPLLPYLVQDNIIDLAQGASLASLNYFGYLIGAVCAVFLTRPALLKKWLLTALFVNTLSTAAQLLVFDFNLFAGLRFINGLSNGLVFVLAPAIVLEWLVEQHKTHLSGWVYLGVSIGLILDCLLVDWVSQMFSGQQRWIPVILVAIPLCLFSLYYLNKIHIQPMHPAHQSTDKLFNQQTTPLLIAYAGAGLGYILPMTFLPALAHQIIPQQSFIVTNTWLFTALSCLISLPFWNRLGVKTNDRFALILCYLIQIISIAVLLIFQNSWGIVLCAILMGGSFMATVVCSQRLAKKFLPDLGAKLYATLISIYAGTQLLGTYFAKIYIAYNGELSTSFIFGLLALIWSFFWMLKVPITD